MREPILDAIERAGDEGETHVLGQLARGLYQLHLVTIGGSTVAGIVTELVTRPGAKVCILRYAGGRKADFWAGEADRALCAFARAEGCTALEVIGRKGWAALADKLGAALVAQVWRKELP